MKEEKMTDEEKLESGQETPETQETPSPAVPSAVSGVEQPSAPSLDLDGLTAQIAEKVRAGLQEDIERGIQSTKDRRFADVEKIAAYLDAHGGDVKKATREMKVDEILARESGSPSPVLGRTEDETTAAFTAISEEILSGADIAFDDAEYLAFVAKHNNKITTPESWRSVLQAHADRRRVQSQRQGNVTPHATTSATGGASPEGGDSYEECAAKLKSLRGKFDPDSMKLRGELQKKMDELEPSMQFVEKRYDALG